MSERKRDACAIKTGKGKRDACATTACKRDACAITFDRPDVLILLGLAVVTFGIYAQVIGHRFVTIDDLSYIADNTMVNHGVTFTGLAGAFTTFHQGNWHPLTWISHMIDCQLFGTFAGGHLLVNALIHTANTLLLFWFLLRTTHARWSSALVAALFALHPLHVESVAWASERKDTLSTFFGLLCLIAYVRYADAPSIRRYAWVAITLALGLMAKPMLVTWPFVMLLLDYWPLGRFRPGRCGRDRTPTRAGSALNRRLPQIARRSGGYSESVVLLSKKYRCLLSWRRRRLSRRLRNLMQAWCPH